MDQLIAKKIHESTWANKEESSCLSTGSCCPQRRDGEHVHDMYSTLSMVQLRASNCYILIKRVVYFP
jgi:hypothetical protein